MSPAEIPDRRPLLYIIMGVVIVAIAAVLFWPQGEEEVPPSMVLTPESVRQAADLATDVEDVDDGAADAAADLPEAEEADVPGESFPVADAKLPADLDAAPKTTSTPAAKPVASSPTTTSTKSTTKSANTAPAPTRLDSSVTPPSSTGDYVIYVGSYDDAANAQRAMSDLKSKGIQAFVMDAGSKHRVAVGYFASSAKAEAYAKTLKSKLGLDYWVGEGR